MPVDSLFLEINCLIDEEAGQLWRHSNTPGMIIEVYVLCIVLAVCRNITGAYETQITVFIVVHSHAPYLDILIVIGTFLLFCITHSLLGLSSEKKKKPVVYRKWWWAVDASLFGEKKEGEIATETEQEKKVAPAEPPKIKTTHWQVIYIIESAVERHTVAWTCWANWTAK